MPAVMIGVGIDLRQKDDPQRKRAMVMEYLVCRGQVTTPKVLEGNTHVYAQYTIRVDENRREEVVSEMKVAGIPVDI